MAKTADIKPNPFPDLNWKDGEEGRSLDKLAAYAMGEAEQAILWYLEKKRSKRRGARFFRGGAIVLAGIAGLIPVLPAIASFEVDPAWATVVAAVAAVMVAWDRFMGYTSGWVRFILAQQEISRVLEVFRLEWEGHRQAMEGEPPDGEQAAAMIQHCKVLLQQVQGIVQQETQSWAMEFQNVIKELDEAVKATERTRQLGAINLSIANGDEVAGEWTLKVDGGAATSHSGKQGAINHLAPGIHTIAIHGTIDGKEGSAEKAVDVAAGAIATVELTLG